PQLGIEMPGFTHSLVRRGAKSRALGVAQDLGPKSHLVAFVARGYVMRRQAQVQGVLQIHRRESPTASKTHWSSNHRARNRLRALSAICRGAAGYRSARPAGRSGALEAGAHECLALGSAQSLGLGVRVALLHLLLLRIQLRGPIGLAREA